VRKLAIHILFIVILTSCNKTDLSGSKPSTIRKLDDSAKDFSLTTTPTLTWEAATDEDGIREYELAIGTTPGGTELLNWKSVGNVLSHQETDLSFKIETTYYASIRAVDNAATVGDPVSSGGWSIPDPRNGKLLISHLNLNFL
jgi:hypothetical protein